MVDLTNLEFGKLKVIRLSGKRCGKTTWFCRCSCGKEKDIYSFYLVRGEVISCGCEKRIKKSERKKLEYKNKEKIIVLKKISKIYNNIKQRCYNKKNPNYKNYGFLGIKMCDEWLNDKSKFIEWCIKNGFEDSKELDKDIKCKKLGIIPHLYSPNTCSFVTKKQNLNAIKVNHILEYNGIVLNTSEWAEKLDLKIGTIYARIRNNWTIEEILGYTKRGYKK